MFHHKLIEIVSIVELKLKPMGPANNGGTLFIFVP